MVQGGPWWPSFHPLNHFGWCDTVVHGVLGDSEVIALVMTMMKLMMIVKVLCLYVLYTANFVQGRIMHFIQY